PSARPAHAPAGCLAMCVRAATGCWSPSGAREPRSGPPPTSPSPDGSYRPDARRRGTEPPPPDEAAGTRSAPPPRPTEASHPNRNRRGSDEEHGGVLEAGLTLDDVGDGHAGEHGTQGLTGVAPHDIAAPI